MKNFSKLFTILSAKATTGIGTSWYCEDWMHAMLQFGSAGSGNFTVKFQISMSDDCPDFSAAQSVSNHWDYCQVVDLQSGSTINGDTGIALSGTDDFRNLELNLNGAKWINAVITAHSAGSATLKAKGFNNA